MVDHIDRIIGARDRDIGHRLRRAHGARDQHGAFRQERRNLVKRVGLAGEEERERGFRPDQVSHVVHAGRLRPAGAVGEREIAVHHLLLLRGVEFFILL